MTIGIINHVNPGRLASALTLWLLLSMCAPGAAVCAGGGLPLKLGKHTVTIPLPQEYKGSTRIPPNVAALLQADRGEGFTFLAMVYHGRETAFFERDLMPESPFFTIGMITTMIPDLIYQESFADLKNELRPNLKPQELTTALSDEKRGKAESFVDQATGEKSRIDIKKIRALGILEESPVSLVFANIIEKNLTLGSKNWDVQTMVLGSLIWVDGKIMEIASYHDLAADWDSDKALAFHLLFIRAILEANPRMR